MDKNPGQPLLALDRVETFYGPLQALRGVSLTVAEGAITAILGNNGAGKSTLLSTILGVLDGQPRQGSIEFDGLAIDGMATEKIVRAGISYVPEGRRLFPELSVSQNLTVGGYIRRDRAATRRTLEQVYEFFPLLSERLSQPAGTLSGGEQQMLAIARALMSAPKLILFDEPSLGLSPFLVQEVASIIRDIHRDGVTVLLVEQNVNMALRLAQRAYVLEPGRVAVSGRSAELLKDDSLLKAYLGG